ncbi:MAG: hypothetical protein IPL28_21825, partial [Chloroflexi bacterium]|nr:hypothetical protein [Chloroflexota bacterium]
MGYWAVDIAIQNSIVWNNEDSSGIGTAESSIYHADAAFTATFSHTLVQGCNPSGAWVASCGIDGGNNLADADPLFVDTPNPSTAPHANGNVRLLAGSPAIDAGDNSANNTAVDLDGHGRIQNGVIDLGAYETATAVCPPSGLLYVNHAATGGNAGTSWADAYTNLQSALTFLSEPCEIWVAR